MLKAEVSFAVNRPPDEVFATMLDLSRWGAWVEGNIDARQVSEGSMDFGAQIRQIFWLIPPIRGSAVYRVTAFEQDRRFEYTTLRSFAVWVKVRWSLELVAGGTRVTMSTEARFDRLLRWMEPLFIGEMKLGLEGQAQKLMRLFEVNRSADPLDASLAHQVDGERPSVSAPAKAIRRGYRPWLAGVVALSGLAAFVALAFNIATHPGLIGVGGQPEWFRILLGLIWGPIMLLMGLWLLWHAPRSMAGLFVCFIGLSLIFLQFTFDLGPPGLSGLALALFVLFNAGIGVPYLSYFMATFPDGKVFPLSARPVWVAFAVVKFAGALLEIMSSNGHIKIITLPVNLLFVPALAPFWPLIAATVGLTGIMLPAGFAAGLASLLFRYRSAGSQIRQQIKWVVWALGVLVVSYLAVVVLIFGWGSRLTVYNFAIAAVIIILAQFGFITALASAVLRYHLFDIDTLINRSLVYGALTVAIVALYIILVGTLGGVFQTGGNLLVSLLATSAVAVAFQPLRERLQRAVNRLMYGERDEPYAVLSRLGWRLKATFLPDEALMAVVETVTQALKLPYAALYVGSEVARTLRAECGRRPIKGTGLVAFSLIHHGEWVGDLVVGQRSAVEPFTPTERRLIEDIAHQAGAAAYAARLTADLQRSREQLVTAREEERRRLRRDLHDGLGTTLTGVRLMIGQALSQLPADSPQAALLAEAKTQTQQAVADIRRLVYGLRPPVLDELGLATALREHAARMGYEFQGPDRLPSLSAAVEVAAYRIAAEAMNNVAKHTQGARCVVRLCDDGAPPTNGIRLPVLMVEVEDNGPGLPRSVREGVGMASMRERASELGGNVSIECPVGGGTRVTARLPLREA